MIVRTLPVVLTLCLFSPRVSWSQEKWQYVRDVVPLVKKYCLDCHDGDEAEGGVNMRGFREAADYPKNRATAEKIHRMLKARVMPPVDAAQPSADERNKWVGWLDDQLFKIDCQQPVDPGRVTIRRLNRVEYNNTVRDLLSLPSNFSPSDAFPSDDVGEGFDNIGDVLSLPPLLFEKYMDAAELAAKEAIVVHGAANRNQARRGKIVSSGGVRADGDRHAFFSQGEIKTAFVVPREGEYLIRIEASGDSAGDEAPKMRLKIGDQELDVIDVPNRRSQPKFFERRVRMRGGEQAISVAFINDFYIPNKADRNLYVSAVQVVGPLNVLPSDLPESHRKLIGKTPRNAKEWFEAAKSNLEPLMRRAFRRPLDGAEAAPYAKMVLLAQERGESFEQGMQVALSAVLVSPQFLFRIERDADPEDPSKPHPLGDYELASRLSYFLWSSMPDDELFTLAQQQRLHEQAVLRGQVKRMLADSKSRNFVENFAGQWLNLRNLAEISPDPARFPQFNDALRKAMEQETLLFFEEVLRKDLPVTELIAGRFSYVNSELAKLYGIPDVSGSRFRRVSLEGLPRSGVLTHASVLSITSNATRTSPVKRGKWFLVNILGDPPPDPPADVPDLAETTKAAPGASLRERLEIHRENPSCAICHTKMDALGFGFENFDAIGRWREKDGDKPIDTSGELPGGVKFSGPEEIVQIFMENRDKFARVMGSRMLTYALGRGLKYYDRCAVDDITDATIKGDYKISAMVTAIVLSDPFLRRRGEGELNE